MATQKDSEPLRSISPEAIRAWITGELARRLKIDARTIDVRERFSRYGLDSVGMASLLADLGRALGRPLSSTLAWRYPTIEALTRYLLVGESVPPARPGEHPSRSSSDESIAIVGLACRFPKAPDPEAYWQLLRGGVDAITELPADRFDVASLFDPDISAPGKLTSRWGGFLEQVDQFDPQFFDISPREAVQIDPQQRLMLELSWEALDDAGMAPRSLKGSKTGVFFGAMWDDYARGPRGDLDLIVQHTATGQDLSIISARVSYTLGLEGPSVTVNTACSSSIVAVHLACQSLLRGESQIALAGGVNLILAPESMVAMSKFGGMAPDGRCKAFDARANGYVRGEGGGVVVLKRLARALADGDPIYCVILGSAVNNDGFSNGLTAPNPKAQEAVLREAYARAGVRPTDVQYVEAHGTGTSLGDPIEARALSAVLCADRPAEQPLRLGSAKTNIGHLEAAAGIAGLIKVALAVKHRQIPPNLHFQEPSPHIPFEELRLEVPKRTLAWPAGDGPVLAGVSGFGFGGTNGHVVVEGVSSSPAHLLPLSAGSADALAALAREVLALATSTEELRPPLAELCALAAARRSRDDHRLAVTTHSHDDLAARLTSFLEGRPWPGVSSGQANGRRPRVVFMFGGHGSQWLGMGRDLLREEPVFRSALAQCGEAMRPYVEWSLLEELTNFEPRSLEATDIVQPTIFAVQVAVAALFRSWGVEPDAVVGQSIGEVAAACVAGALSLDDAARVICRRSQIVKRVSGRGALAVAGLSPEDARRVVGGRADRLAVAVINSPSSTVLSGDTMALEEVLADLGRQGIFYRTIKMDYASHSQHIDELCPDLMLALDGLCPHPGTTPFYSTVTGALLSGEELGAAYWVRNEREPVLFASAVERLLDDGHDIFLEISPHPLLTHAVEQNLSHARRSGTVLPSLRRQEAARSILLESLGALYARGATVRWDRLYPVGREASSSPSLRALARLLPELAAGVPPPEDLAAPELLVLSARSAAALGVLARSLSTWLTERSEGSLSDVCYTASARRSHHEHRLAVVGRSREEMAAGLESFSRGEARSSLAHGRVSSGSRPRVVFVFPGQGSQWTGMGRALLAQEPVFRRAIEACDQAIWKEAGWSLLRVLRGEDEPSRLDAIDVVQPALLAMAVALSALWRSWGVEPDAVVGHSMGEVAAAHVAGALCLRDAVRIICRRSSLLRRVSGQGLMALVELPRKQAEEALAGYDDRLSVAAINSPRSTVLSGDLTALEEVLARLTEENVFCRRIKVDVASHSPQMDPLQPELLDALATLTPSATRVPMHSTVTGGICDGRTLVAEYWAKNLRAPVLFSQAIEGLLASNHTLFVEMSPHPILVPAIEEGLRAAGYDGVALGSLRREQEEQSTLLSSLGALYARGYEMDWSRLYPSGGRMVALPTYPWQRQRYWLETSSTSAPRALRATFGSTTGHPFLRRHLRGVEADSAAYWEAELSLKRFPYLSDHRVGNVIVLPATAYLEMILAAATELFGEGAIHLASLRFRQALFVPEQGEQIVKLSFVPVGPSAAEFRIHSRPAGPTEDGWKLHVTGSAARPPDAVASVATPALHERLNALPSSLDPCLFYERIGAAGVQYGPHFQAIKALRSGGRQVVGQVALPGVLANEATRYRFHPVLFDACLQVMATPLATEKKGQRSSPFMPTYIESVSVLRRAAATAVSHVTLREDAGEGKARITGDIQILSEDGCKVAELCGLEFQLLDYQNQPVAIDDPSEWLYEISWRELPRPEKRSDSRPVGTWLIIEPDGVFDARMLDGLSGSRCIRVQPGTAFARHSATSYTVDPERPADFARLIDAVRSEGGPAIQGIVHLGGVAAGSPEPWSPSELGRTALRACLSTLYLLRALNDVRWSDAPKLWLFTRESQRARDLDAVTGLAGAPLWGLGKAIAAEHAAFWGGLIDLDREGDATRDVAALQWVVRAGSDEDHLAFRGDAVYAARLERRKRKAAPSSVSLRPDASYLITGGLGELGLRIARWIVQQGGRRVILLGRHGLPAREGWRGVGPETPTGRRIAAVLDLERLGAAVTVIEADVADKVALRRFVDAHDRACLPPIGGVIHAAGAIRPRLLVETSADDLAAQLLPKVQGSWALHCTFADRPLDFLVYFSSGSSLLNSPQLGAYAAANSFLDVLSHHRRTRGLAATSINWGFWDAGMAVHNLSAASGEATPKGMRPFTTQQGLDLLGRLIMEAPAQAAVMPMNWTEWFDLHPEAYRSPMLATLREEARLAAPEGGAPTVGPEDLRSRLLAAAPEGRWGLLAKGIAQQVGAVLRLPVEQIDENKQLGSLGLDSLMGMELRNRLEAMIGVTLSVTMVWNYPTVKALTRYLSERIGLDALSAEPKSTSPKVKAGPSFEEELAAMSNEDTERLLLAELESMGL